jgi:beta-glucosidase/6-phospho-beta-glucosidase/beta-galactosidase
VNRWRKTRGNSGGQIGISLSYEWVSPLEDSPQNWNTSQLDHDFNLGWFADPIYLSGDYPASMREGCGHFLPNFTDEEKALIKGSYHGFFGLNSYTAHYVKPVRPKNGGTVTDFTPEEQPIGPLADSKWLRVVPWAMPLLLDYINRRYRPSSIIITENGCDVPHETDMPLEQALNDAFRISYFRSYLSQISLGVQVYKIPLQGYFAWSLLDNFEWNDGYTKRFGLTYVNFTTLERHPKASAKWFANLSRRIFPVAPGEGTYSSIQEFSLRGGQQSASMPVQVTALFIALAVGLVATVVQVRRLRQLSEQREPVQVRRLRQLSEQREPLCQDADD